MKKLLIVLRALCLALPTALVLAEGADPAGVWYLTKAYVGETEMDPAMLGMNVTMTLNEDGSAVVATAYGDEVQEEKSEWALGDGVVTLKSGNDEPVVFAIVDDTLTIDNDGIGMVFTREPNEPFEAPPALAAESEDAFAGTWDLVLISMGGVRMSPEMFGMEDTLAVEPGKVVETSAVGENEQKREMTAQFVDGAMQLYNAEDGAELGLLQLREDGTVSLTVTLDEGNEMTMYYEKAE